MNSFSYREFSTYALPRIIVAVVVALALVWASMEVFSFFGANRTARVETVAAKGHGPVEAVESHEGAGIPVEEGIHENAGPAVHHGSAGLKEEGESAAGHGKAGKTHNAPEAGVAAGHAKTPGHEDGSTESPAEVKGVAFVNAAVQPLEHELDRFWGWRPNDIIQFTDNVNNFQLGVLEVTRRTAVMLAERISRTGTTDVIDENLEHAMNWFMIKADSFWFPSAENMYRSGINEMKVYAGKLAAGQARFFTRADNLIPLLRSYANLLGGCDENLVKDREDTGEPVSTFAADNYFYYAKGVASAMLPILEAISDDFRDTIESRGSTDTLHHAILACQHASELSPIIVFEGDKDGVLANHRANMAAYISHARFYLDVLVGALST